MEIIRRKATARELLNLPDDGFRYELVRGELRQMNPAGNIHGRIAIRFTWRLARHAEENRLGEVYAAETGFKTPPTPTPSAPPTQPLSAAKGSTRFERPKASGPAHQTSMWKSSPPATPTPK
ncbi:MAG: Uma2 family endonuclease [Rubrobacter sp.]